eukprot:Blabericola_migrator_1__4664@NODE_2467_length_2718_cov_137_907205_g1544_i0_p2_GENE_NODE_2467_length_2718_cov_137_907205_g1544_i0NODE_2467_length_2718_cov_137_907205_g1544_i0_p2_ORF_typecomplete_len209_score80_77p25alpha/PF05517_12/1_3e35TOPRIM_C/PF16898_5/0_028TOPRIM_C/PF16898_5/9_7e03TOPRIM_C/PF16898_5/1_8e03_NODE_2467_length_2718_cov_137_907205_g1544_i020442670
MAPNDKKGGPLEEIFLKYCQFGAGLNKPTQLDNAKFFKLAKETEIIDDKLTRAAVDIIFQKVMKKERKMNFEQFKLALDLMAKKKEINYEELVEIILSHGGPKKNNVTEVSNEDWVQKQTNPELYTGMHKYRFDQEGKGRGVEGRRDELDAGDPLANLLDRSSADIRGRKVDEVEKRKRDEDKQKEVLEKKKQAELASAHVKEAISPH